MSESIANYREARHSRTVSSIELLPVLELKLSFSTRSHWQSFVLLQLCTLRSVWWRLIQLLAACWWRLWSGARRALQALHSSSALRQPWAMDHWWHDPRCHGCKHPGIEFRYNIPHWKRHVLHYVIYRYIYIIYIYYNVILNILKHMFTSLYR